MKAIGRLLLISVLSLRTGVLVAATEHEERLAESASVLQAILDTPERGIPQDLLDKSECIGIIPSVKKFAFGFGGRYGSGYVVCRKEAGRGPWGCLCCADQDRDPGCGAARGNLRRGTMGRSRPDTCGRWRRDTSGHAVAVSCATRRASPMIVVP